MRWANRVDKLGIGRALDSRKRYGHGYRILPQLTLKVQQRPKKVQASDEIH